MHLQLVPSAGSSVPAGWTVLPVFERCGRFVASGCYELPLFQVRKGRPDGVEGLPSGMAHVAAPDDCCSMWHAPCTPPHPRAI